MAIDNGSSLMAMPADLDTAPRKFVPPFADPYSTDLPVAVLGTKYRWVRGVGVMRDIARPLGTPIR